MIVERATMPAIDRDATAKRLLDRYLARTTTSRRKHEAARRVMPGGDTRTVAFHPPYPLTIERGAGYELVDADGNEYIDLLNNYTSLIHGHAHAAINDAVTEQIARGTNFAAAIESQTRLAALLVDRIPSVDKVRFTNSGTEATMNAVRAARAYTGRDLIVKMEGGYHGTYDDFEISVHPAIADAGPEDTPTATFDTRGIPSNTAQSVAVVPVNNIAAVEALFAKRAPEVAAVIIEPVLGSAGMIPAEVSYLQALRELTTSAGALLIFDEVMSFRLETGGYQQFAGVSPDLTTMAKIIGGGFPVGAFGGSEAVMSQFDPTTGSPLWQSGTFNGNAVTTVAGAVAMEHFGADEVARINGLGARLRSGLAESMEERMIPATVTGYGSFAGVHFGVQDVRNYRDAASSDQTFKRLVHLALLLEGVFAAPRLMFCTSTPMSEETVDDVVARFGRALDVVRL